MNFQIYLIMITPLTLSLTILLLAVILAKLLPTNFTLIAPNYKFNSFTHLMLCLATTTSSV